MRISVDLNSYHFVSDCSLDGCLISLRSMGVSEYMRILHQHNRTSSEIKSTSIHDGRNGLVCTLRFHPVPSLSGILRIKVVAKPDSYRKGIIV